MMNVATAYDMRPRAIAIAKSLSQIIPAQAPRPYTHRHPRTYMHACARAPECAPVHVCVHACTGVHVLVPTCA